MVDIDKLVCDFLNPGELLGKEGIKRIEDEIRKTEHWDYTYFLIQEALTASLKRQGLEYKDGSLHYIGEEEVKKPEPVNFEDFPREEQLKWYICTKSIPQKDGGFMPLFCEGEPATIEKIFSMCPELKNDVALFVEHFRKVTEDDLPKKPDTIKFEEPIQSEGQKDQVETFYCTPPEKFPPLLKAEHYMLLYKDFERLLDMIHKKVSSLPEHKVDAYFSWLQTELSKRVKHHQEEARLLEDFHNFYRVPKPEI